MKLILNFMGLTNIKDRIKSYKSKRIKNLITVLITLGITIVNEVVKFLIQPQGKGFATILIVMKSQYI